MLKHRQSARITRTDVEEQSESQADETILAADTQASDESPQKVQINKALEASKEHEGIMLCLCTCLLLTSTPIRLVAILCRSG